MRSLAWTFVKKPLRRYEVPQRHQDSPIERSLSPSNVFLDAFDLLQNQRGVGWSWSPNPFPRESTPSTSISLIAVKTLLTLTAFDASQYLIQYACPSVNKPGGGSIFDPRLSFIPRTALAAFSAICGGVWSYALLDSGYHVALLVARAVFREPASLWPRAFDRPWMSTSIHEFWSFRWHQFFRHLYVTFGARPGGMFFGKPGAFINAFAVSAIQHHICVWGIGSGSELMTTGGFFLLMGVGAVVEVVFKKVTGMQVRGWAGWTWTMLWTTLWGAFMIDGWARHGIFASVFFPDRLRPGKMIVDTIIGLSIINAVDFEGGQISHG